MPSASQDVSGQLVRLMRLIGTIKAQSAARSTNGVEWSAYALLYHLVTDGPQRSKSLADRLHSDPSTVSRQAASLIENGLVDRQPDPGDGRAALLAATARGHEVFATMRAHRDQMFQAVLADWSPDDAVRFSQLLERFNADFEKHMVDVLHMVQLDPTAAHRSPTLQETA